MTSIIEPSANIENKIEVEEGADRQEMLKFCQAWVDHAMHEATIIEIAITSTECKIHDVSNTINGCAEISK